MLAEKACHAAADVDGRVAFAFRRVLGRRPTADDLAALERTFERQLAFMRADESAARALLAVGESPRDEGLDVAEHAALAAVCLAILNLDEALTRE